MMDDRELLELAAKAVGKELLGWDYNEITKAFMYAPPHLPPMFWAPLTDDGDALRLCVDTGYPHMIGTWLGCYLRKGEYEADPHAATRRAITHAAAEIGKAMS